MAIALSVLVPCLPERLEHAAQLLQALCRQAEGRPVEILGLLDNRWRSTGAKMNELVALAQGERVSMVADDDRVEGDYVEALLREAEARPDADLIAFDVAFHLRGTFVKIFRYGQEYSWRETDACIYRAPAPFLCWRREVMLRHPFPDLTSGEDAVWMATGPWTAGALRQARIERVLYHYLAEPGHR